VPVLPRLPQHLRRPRREAGGDRRVSSGSRGKIHEEGGVAPLVPGPFPFPALLLDGNLR
jgi:hypothetical protein